MIKKEELINQHEYLSKKCGNDTRQQKHRRKYTH